jgi:hypothetical protein
LQGNTPLPLRDEFGRKARKKRPTFGFTTFIMNPRRKRMPHGGASWEPLAAIRAATGSLTAIHAR